MSSFQLYFKPNRDRVEKMIKDHVDRCRRSIPWDDEHKAVVNDIFDLLRNGPKKVKKTKENACPE